MNEMTTFEQHLGERLRSDALRRARPFDSNAIARMSRQGAERRQFRGPTSMRLIFAIAITALLLLALMGAAIVFGQRPTADSTPATTAQPTVAAALAPTILATAAPASAASPEPTTSRTPGPTPATQEVSGTCWSTLLAGYQFSAMAVPSSEGCFQVSSLTWVELDRRPRFSWIAPDLEFQVDRRGTDIRRLTQAHMVFINATDADDPCPRQLTDARLWADSLRLDAASGNRVCVITNGGAVVQLQVDTSYRGKGPVPIIYATMPEAVP
jgi:hypothetical protein